MLSHKQKVQGEANALCCFAVLICAACVCRGIVEVVALLGFIQRGLCCKSAVWAIVDQVAAAIKNKPGPATAAISAQRDMILSLKVDIAMLTD